MNSKSEASESLHLKLDPMMQMHYKMRFHQGHDLIPVIIQVNNPNTSELKNLILDWGGSIKAELSIIEGLCGEVPHSAISDLINEPKVSFVSFDDKVHALMDIAGQEVGAPFAMDLGYTGHGITVALLDTGIYPHDDLIKPINRIQAFKDFVNHLRNPYDDNGHGTHLAGCIAGNGNLSEGKFSGVAPKASLLGIKVLDNTGHGYFSDILLGLQWVLETQSRYNTKVVCLPFGANTMTPARRDPMCCAIQNLIDNDLIVITCAGNNGPHEGNILSPGIAPNAITIGAADDRRTFSLIDDTVAAFSSRGRTIDGILKPDITTPGVNITSLASDIGYFPSISLNRIPPRTLINPYHSMTGTSVAAAIAAGATALLLEKNPKAKPFEIKDLLLQNSTKLTAENYRQGIGLINLRKLLNK